MSQVVIVGAGNIGSRHLQALKSVKYPLTIHVIDPSEKALKISKERYDSIHPDITNHEVSYSHDLNIQDNQIDIAIIATTSKVRRAVIENLLEHKRVQFFILEKILFQEEEDYFFIEKLLDKNNCMAWVNCTRRLIPFYQNELKKLFNKQKLFFSVNASNWGLISNIIHYLDLIVYFIESEAFSIDTTYLDPNPIPSKREEFIDLTGILQVHFKNGSHGIFNSFPSGNLPGIVEIASDSNYCIINESEGRARILERNDQMEWKDYEAKLIPTSQLTTNIVEDILEKKTCSLTPYKSSMNLHLSFLKPILKFLNDNSKHKYSHYPFT
ncbi:MAG: Gfo/Idh/MocA family oxidoreductase [Candidatus Odinarchaeota archaeon]